MKQTIVSWYDNRKPARGGQRLLCNAPYQFPKRRNVDVLGEPMIVRLIADRLIQRCGIIPSEFHHG